MQWAFDDAERRTNGRMRLLRYTLRAGTVAGKNAQEIRGKVTVEGVVKTSSDDFEIRAGVLVKYHGEDTEIVIPQGVVKEIGVGCFSGCQYITSVVLPDRLKKISDSAFFGCSSLEKINIPDSVNIIGRVLSQVVRH